MKPVDTSLLANALKDALSFGVQPHEIGCTEEELNEMVLIMNCKVAE